jgi:hypothetical protein
MLRAAFCAFPNPFSFLSSDPYEALWQMEALCALVLGLVTLVLQRRTGWSPIAWFSLASTVGAGLLAVLSGRQATIGLVCAGISGATPAANQAAGASATTLQVFQALGVVVCVLTMVLLVVGVRRVLSYRHTAIRAVER